MVSPNLTEGSMARSPELRRRGLAFFTIWKPAARDPMLDATVYQMEK
jgi:hypothetical protein